MPFKPHPRPVLVQPTDPNVRLIPLTQGYITRVSTVDYEELSQYNWFPFKSEKGKKVIYVTRWVTDASKKKGRKIVFMHKQIFPQWQEIDHIDGDGLNNVRDNLRDCLHSQNGANRTSNSNNTSGYKGVFFHTRDNYWFAAIGINSNYTWLGRCTNAIDAARRYDRAAIDAFGVFAVTNFPVADYATSDLGKDFQKSGKSYNNTSGYKGVSWNKKGKKWQAEGRFSGTRFYLGMFPGTEEGKVAAAHAYDRWVIQHRVATAYTNFPRSHYPDLVTSL